MEALRRYIEMEKLSREKLEEMFDKVGPFKEGLATVQKDGKYYHVREDGTPTYTKRFDWAGSFRGGLALVRKSGQSYYIRHNGTRVDP